MRAVASAAAATASRHGTVKSSPQRSSDSTSKAPMGRADSTSSNAVRTCPKCGVRRVQKYECPSDGPVTWPSSVVQSEKVTGGRKPCALHARFDACM